MNTKFKATLGSLISLIISGAIIYFIISLVSGILKFFLVAGVTIIALGIIYKIIHSLFKE